MKLKDIPILEQRVLAILPISQGEMWKTLGISSQDGADLVEVMLKDKLIKRTQIKESKNRQRYMLEHFNGNGKLRHKKKAGNKYAALIHNGQFSPCAGCQVDPCQPHVCAPLDEWVMGTAEAAEAAGTA